MLRVGTETVRPAVLCTERRMPLRDDLVLPGNPPSSGLGMRKHRHHRVVDGIIPGRGLRCSLCWSESHETRKNPTKARGATTTPYTIFAITCHSGLTRSDASVPHR